jgi:hypothetical protein
MCLVVTVMLLLLLLCCCWCSAGVELIEGRGVVKGPHEVEVDGRSITVRQQSLLYTQALPSASERHLVLSFARLSYVAYGPYRNLLHLAHTIHDPLPIPTVDTLACQQMMQATAGFCLCAIQLLLLLYACSAVRMFCCMQTRNIVVATGGQASHIPIPGAEHAIISDQVRVITVMTADVTATTNRPATMLILGAEHAITSDQVRVITVMTADVTVTTSQPATMLILGAEHAIISGQVRVITVMTADVTVTTSQPATIPSQEQSMPSSVTRCVLWQPLQGTPHLSQPYAHPRCLS